MKTSRLILILASLGSMFISFVPAIVQANRRLATKQELAQRLDTFGKRRTFLKKRSAKQNSALRTFSIYSE